MPYLPTQSTLPAPANLAPQAQFTRERQVRFLEALSVSGNVRAACRSACISPQTAYRLRRACRQFARAWDAACLAARAQVEQVLADRALNGFDEPVFYHGEEVARRRRYDSRLLLAHLARLDKLAENADLAETAASFDAALDTFRAHGALEPPPPKPAPEPANEPAPVPLDDDPDRQSVDHEDADEYEDDYEDDYEDGDNEDGTGAFSYLSRSSESVPEKSARDLDLKDLHRLSEEDWAYVVERLREQAGHSAALRSPAPDPDPDPDPARSGPHAPPTDEHSSDEHSSNERLSNERRPDAPPPPEAPASPAAEPHERFAPMPPIADPRPSPKIVDFPTMRRPLSGFG